MDLSRFRSAIGTGIVRPNQFRVTLPSNIPGQSQDISAQSEFLVNAASLPQSNVDPIPVFYRGRATYTAGERTFQPWTVRVYNENFNVRDVLMQWSNSFNNVTTNEGILTMADYQREIFVEQLDRNDTVAKTITLVDAFPINISEIELDFANNNTVESFTCTFIYNYWVDSAVNQPL